MNHSSSLKNYILQTFHVDIRSFISEQLKPIGLNKKSVEFINKASLESLLLQFIYFRKRYPIGKYNVLIAKGMCFSQKYYIYKNQILHIKKLLEEGHDIKDYLHKDIADFLFHDDLLQDWGIMHIHLWPKELRKKRDNDILYAIQIKNNILFLKIDTHKCFLDEELLEILYQNTPEFLCFFPIIGNNFTEKEIKSLRKKSISYALNLKNTSFCGGMNHTLSYVDSIQILVNLDKLSELIAINFQCIKTTIEKEKKYTGDIKLHLGINSVSRNICVYEANSSTEIRLENINIMEKLTNCFINLHLF